LEEFIKNQQLKKEQQDDVKFISGLVRLSPPLNKDSAKNLQLE
jgi:hypothetical protein